MSAWQHTKPKSGDQRKERGGVVLRGLKHMTNGP